MKKIIKKAIVPVFLSIICGFICGHLVYKIYLDDDMLSFNNNVIYLIQSGAYSSYDNMRANTIGYDYIYYEEDNLYKTVIGITKNKNNIGKIKESYGSEVVVNEYYTDNIDLNSKLISYDSILYKEDDDDKIKEIIIDMLNLYKDSNINLTKVS